jgi:hypothetical protein
VGASLGLPPSAVRIAGLRSGSVYVDLHLTPNVSSNSSLAAQVPLPSSLLSLYFFAITLLCWLLMQCSIREVAVVHM